MTTMTEVIDVDTDPQTVFTVFTDEFDRWWGRGPIDAYDTWRLVARRIEGGVGGRLVEDYGDEERVTGTTTIWPDWEGWRAPGPLTHRRIGLCGLPRQVTSPP